MKLLADIFPCQTHSRFRGIGRYTLSLTQAMAKTRNSNDMVVLANANYIESFEDLRQEFIRTLPSGSFLPYYHEPLTNASPENADQYNKIAAATIEHAYQVIAPEIVLTPSLFEGWGGGEHGTVPPPNKKYPNQKRAAILYDIIPLVFQKQYLDPDPGIKKWYLEKINMLNDFDLLLAISEATRQDAINHLGLNPNKVVNISGAASSQFGIIQLTDSQKKQYLIQFKISRPFVLYIGGNDFRKNMEGALRAFAKLPREIISRHQLVLNDVGDEAAFRSKARKLGLNDSDLVIFKRVTDEDLVVLYNLCKLFFFPSIYEGFGLPILEAMSCGAPVLASNNSSLPEVVGREDALFDVSNEQATSELISRTLTDGAFRTDLISHGLKHSKKFSWELSATRAWNALENLANEKRTEKTQFLPAYIKSKFRIAYVSPLPPQKSGIANYSAELLPYLAEIFKIDLFAQPGLKNIIEPLVNNFSIFPYTKLIERRDKYDAVIYHMGNSEIHIPMIELLQEVPGVIVNHDFFLSNLPFVKEIRTGEKDVFYKEMENSHGLNGVVDYIKHGVEDSRWKWPLNINILKRAQELIVHSNHQIELIDKYYGNGWKPNATLIKHFRKSVPVVFTPQKEASRKDLGLNPDAFIFCSFGFMAPTKLNNRAIQAFSKALPNLPKDSKLIFVGQLEGGEYGLETLDLIKNLNLDQNIDITGYVNMQDYEKYLACADVAIQLRTDSRGETSGALLDCLAFGLATIINAHGSFNDYPEESVIKLLSNPGIDEIAKAVVRVYTDNSFRLEKGQKALNMIVEHHDPKKIARAYSEILFSAIQTKEQKLFDPLINSVFNLGSPTSLIDSSVRYAAENLSSRSQPRILIDLTDFDNENILPKEKQGAIKTIREIIDLGDPSIRLDFVLFSGEQLMRANKAAEELFNIPAHSLGSEKPIFIRPGDILLMLEGINFASHQPTQIYARIRQKGGKIITFAHKVTDKLLTTLAMESDSILCNSLETANNIQKTIELSSIKFPRLLDVFYYNSNISTSLDWRECALWLLDPRNNEYINKLNYPTLPNEAVPIASNHTESQNAMGKLVAEDQSAPINDKSLLKESDTPNTDLLISSVCSQEMHESDDFQAWVVRMKGRKWWMHRKLWEWAYISQVLQERGFLKPGIRGLGFAVGQEPLPALFASYGCEILATDLETEEAGEKGWVDTNQHATELNELNIAQLCPDDIFNEKVSFRFADMNQIDENLEGFDFIWSSCSLEHLGSLEHGKQFIYNAMKCLKPGGLAIHTTEYNISSNENTIEEGPDVIYRRKDIEAIADHLQSEGHIIDLDFTHGNKPFDLIVDRPPFKQVAHLRLEIGGYTCTSYGLIIQKGNERNGN